jgi:putative methionine-R-sulfoxide reductase with GAF domain
VLDLDSPSLDRFSERDREALEQLAALYVASSDLPEQ